MSKLKILLLSPTYIDEPNTMYFPIGMAYLASYIASKDFYVDGLNMNNTGYEQGLLELQKKLDKTNFDVIGMGMLTVGFEQVQKMIKVLRTMTKAKIVIGGGLTSCESNLVMEELQPDYMALGEAELIFEEILLHIYDSKNPLPKGSWSNCPNESHINSESYSVSELDSLPFPDYKLMGIEGYIKLQDKQKWAHHKSDPYIGKNIPISASRSCPFKCTFCHHAGMGAYRKHSIDYAVKFIKMLISEYNINYFMIYDELFSLNKKRAMYFCEQIMDLNIKFFCQLRVDQIDEELMMTMKNAGCVLISYGLESGSQTVLDSMQKKTTAEQIENTINLTRKAQIGIQGNFLFGDIAETKETLNESLAFQEKNKLYFADWSMVIPYPGTPLHNYALRKNMINDRVQFIKDVSNTSKYLWNKPLNLTQFTDDEYIKLYTELRELNDVNHRKMLSKVKSSEIIGKFHSNMDIECPICNNITTYDSVPFPIDEVSEVRENRASFFGFLGINIVCPKCKQEHHLLPKDIPHVKDIFISFNKKLKTFINNEQNNIVVMPGIDRYYNSISKDIELSTINPSLVLDSREYRIGEIFLNQKIEKLTEEKIVNNHDKKFIILPWVEAENAYSMLLKNGIDKKDILSWNIVEEKC